MKKRTPIVTRLIVTLILSSAVAGPNHYVSAQTEGDWLAVATECSNLVRDRARLACFDAAMANLSTAVLTPEIQENEQLSVLEDTPQASVFEPTAAQVRDAFGRVELIDLPDELSVTVTEVMTPRNGRTSFVTSDEQTWIQTDTYRRRFPAVPFDARITQAAMGSFYLHFPNGGRAIRIARRD